jgi:hypothetical protein
MEPLALPSSSPTGTGHHLHRPLLHSGWGFQSASPSAAAPPPDMETVSSYEASVVATSLLPPGDAWSHHPMLATPAPAPQHWIKVSQYNIIIVIIQCLLLLVRHYANARG